MDMNKILKNSDHCILELHKSPRTEPTALQRHIFLCVHQITKFLLLEDTHKLSTSILLDVRREIPKSFKANAIAGSHRSPQRKVHRSCLAQNYFLETQQIT